ncbi:transposase domain-containing protein [Pelagicoccus mobilis]|uniref:Transposase domain-containing protein n=1 Tax=Pelagicoccus mobilis TaxID=415221 RepID=A0A934RYJ4_9BACT|nr:transposase domain-containing protein [Pelagicoccus mobilis]MBK1877216.1 transposase domain-containing protein [Pelagicoccus mobilis]
MKNWLFAGSPKAGKTAAMTYTILECCRRCGVEPTTYLEDVLEKLPKMMESETNQLTPASTKKNQVNRHLDRRSPTDIFPK